MTFLTDAPLAQLDRALDYELLGATRLSPCHSSVFSRLGPPPSGQEVTVCVRKRQQDANPAETESVVKRSPASLPYPALYLIVDLLPVAYREDVYDLALDFENDAEISNPEFPVPSQALP